MVPKHQDLQTNFQKNLAFLPSLLQKRVLAIKDEDLWKRIEIIPSEEGVPVCRYKEDRTSFQINSIKPLREAENWCNSLSIEDAGALFVYGSGFGYPLFALLKHKQPNTLVMVFEQNLYLFKAMLYYFDLEPLFVTQKFTFFVGDIDDFRHEFQQVFFSEVFLYSTAPYIVFTPTAQRNFKMDYLKIHTHIFKELNLNVFYMGNDHYDTLLGFHNLMNNVMEVIHNPYFSILKGKYKKVPAFIIANGPSLDLSLEELKKIDGKGLIISTESAIVPLIKNNIKPDILCIVERTIDSHYYHFKDQNYPDDISLIALALIDPHIFPSFSGPKIPLFRSTESVNVWVNQMIGDQESKIDAGANVSHLAFEIAAYLGADPIILVGQNYAFGPDGITHSKDAVYLTEKGKKALNTIKSKPVAYVENNEGKQIPTTLLWLDFKNGLERKISSHPQIKVINTTEGGAKIHGAELEKIDTVIEKYCTTPLKYRVNQLIEENKKKINIDLRREKLKKLILELYHYAEKYHHLCQTAIKGKVRSRHMLDLTEEDLSDELIKNFNQAYEDNFYDARKFMKDNLYLVFLQQVLTVGFHKMNRLGVINSPEKIKKIFKIYEELFMHLNMISQSVAVTFEKTAEKLEENL